MCFLDFLDRDGCGSDCERQAYQTPYHFWAELCALIANVRLRPAVGPEFVCQVRRLQRKLGEARWQVTASTMPRASAEPLPPSLGAEGPVLGGRRSVARTGQTFWNRAGRQGYLCEGESGQQLTACCLSARIEPGQGSEMRSEVLQEVHAE